MAAEPKGQWCKQPEYFPKRNTNICSHKYSEKRTHSDFVEESKLEKANSTDEWKTHPDTIRQRNLLIKKWKMSYWHKEQHGRILEVCEAKETRHWKKKCRTACWWNDGKCKIIVTESSDPLVLRCIGGAGWDWGASRWGWTLYGLWQWSQIWILTFARVHTSMSKFRVLCLAELVDIFSPSEC